MFENEKRHCGRAIDGSGIERIENPLRRVFLAGLLLRAGVFCYFDFLNLVLLGAEEG